MRGTPVVVLPRRQLALWTRLAAARHEDEPVLSSRADKVVAFLRDHGASFFDELVGGAHLLRTELEDALAELVARGRVHCDSFAGLRALLVPASRRPSRHARRGRRTALFGIEDARPGGFRRGATCCASIAGWRRVARSGAGVSSRA